MQIAPWEEGRLPFVARIAGLLGIAFVVITFLPGTLGGPLFDNVSTAQILDWAKHNATGITLDGFVVGLTASILAVFVFVLVVVSGGRGILATTAAAAACAFMAIDWSHAGINFALADAAGRADADAGIVALFSLDKAMTFADGFVFGLAVLSVSFLAANARSLPAPLIWLGVLVGAYHLVALPIQLAINGSASGITGPISVLSSLLWILATSAVLLIRPLWGRQLPKPLASATV